MNIQGFSGVNQVHGGYGEPRVRQGLTIDDPTSGQTSSATRVSISDQARTLARTDSAIEARMANIKSKPSMDRSAEEFDFIQKNDAKLAQILAKDPSTQTAEEIDYMQQASGFVNTMANLNPKERQLYNELVSNGESDALNGMSLIAMSRMGTGDVALPNGVTFNPDSTEISSSNVRRLFSRLFANEDGSSAKSFDALAKYLDSKG